MELQDFIDAVLKRLPEIPEKFDLQCTIDSIRKCYKDGFSLDDAVRFNRCLEHVNPELSEETALRRMHEISMKYRRPKGGPNED